MTNAFIPKDELWNGDSPEAKEKMQKEFDRAKIKKLYFASRYGGPAFIIGTMGPLEERNPELFNFYKNLNEKIKSNTTSPFNTNGEEPVQK